MPTEFSNITKGLILSIGSFPLYIEYKIGNIWYRQDDTGIKKVNIYNLLKFMVSPLWKLELWNYNFILDNFFLYVSLTWYPLYLFINYLSH
jgi:hypothetical protein